MHEMYFALILYFGPNINFYLEYHIYILELKKKKLCKTLGQEAILSQLTVNLSEMT